MIPLSNLDTRELICSNDEAIDKEKSDLDNFRSTHDARYLKFIEGKDPTIFVIGPIDRKDFNHYWGTIMSTIDKGLSEEKLNKIVELFSRYVVDIKNLFVNDEPVAITKTRSHGRDILSDDVLKYIPGSVFSEIAFSMLNDAKLSVEEQKK